MKYIKTYNESISDEFLNIIKDICIELEDIGFSNRIGDKNDEYTLFINKKGKPFTFDEVSDVVKRISDYLGDKLILVLAEIKKNEYYSDRRHTTNQLVCIYREIGDLDRLSPFWTNSDIYDIKMIFRK